MSPALLLLSWYQQHGRKLPWRETRLPYAIVVSELMLQQTQVSRVIDFYHRWLAKFPDWQALAKAGNAEVIEAWAGLGYNRRGLMLRDMARQVVEQGEPTTEEGWRSLKGIGPYTAAAVSAFALKQRSLPIDTNIRRVLARVLLGIPYPELSDDDLIRKAFDQFLPTEGNFYDVPQALFDLATMFCTKTPACAVCPLKDQCLAAPKFLAGEVATPVRMTKKAKEKMHRDKQYPDRIYRGRILKFVREHKEDASIRSVGSCVDATFDAALDQAWLEAMVGRLVKDGLLARQGDFLTLP